MFAFAGPPQAACGLDCSTCTIHLRTPEGLRYWEERGADLTQICCDGCRSDRAGRHWSPDCVILTCCVYERGLAYCSDCPDFVCDKLEAWAGELAHHRQALDCLRARRRAAANLQDGEE